MNQYLDVMEKVKRREIKLGNIPGELVIGIEKWYKGVSGESNNKEKAIEAFLFFFCHDNVDMYPISDFKKICIYLKDNYSIPEEKVIFALFEYRKLIGEI